MEDIKLIRYANEGFQNYKQSHIKVDGEVIEGCYAFIDDEYPELLSLKPDLQTKYPEVPIRTNHVRNEVFVSSDTKVYTVNHYLFPFYLYSEEDKNAVIQVIPFKGNTPIDEFIEVEIGMVVERYRLLKELYQEIKEKYGDDISINTNIETYCQVIINANYIK